MNYWLVKQDPANYPFEHFQKEKKTDWTGVRNYHGSQFIFVTMKKGDEVFYTIRVTEKIVVGFASVSKTFFPDRTADEGAWVAVELEAGKPLKNSVIRLAIKAESNTREYIVTCKERSRLSVMPLTKAEFDRDRHNGEADRRPGISPN